MQKKIILGVIFLSGFSFQVLVGPVDADNMYKDKAGGGMQQIDPPSAPDPRLQQLSDLTTEKSNLELNVRDLENSLNSDYAKNNPLIHDTISDNLANARNRLNEVNGKITDLNQQLQSSQPEHSILDDLDDTPQAQTGAQTQPPIESVLGDLDRGNKTQPRIGDYPSLSLANNLSPSSCGRDEHGYYDKYGHFDDYGYYDEDGYYWYDENGNTYDEDGYFDEEGYYDPPPGPRIKDSINWSEIFLPKNSSVYQAYSNKISSTYANDKWKLNDRWSFNLGARYDTPVSDQPPVVQPQAPQSNQPQTTPQNTQPQTQTNQPQATTPSTQAQVDAKRQEKANLEKNIQDLEKGLKSPMANDPMVRQSIEDNLKNAREQLGNTNREIENLEKAQPSQAQQPQAQTAAPGLQSQLDAKRQEKANLEKNIRDLEKGLKGPMANDPMVRGSIEDNLKNARQVLDGVNRDIQNLESQPKTQPTTPQIPQVQPAPNTQTSTTGQGSFKVAEDNPPRPQDRVFLNPGASSYTNDLPGLDKTISPRLGLSYQLGDKTLVKANYALYADQLGAGQASGFNPLTSNYTYTYLLGGLDNEGFNHVDPDLSSPKTHEVVTGLTDQIGKDTSVGVNGTYRRRFNDLYSTPLVQDAGSEERKYDAVETTLNKSFSDNWGLVTSYRYARLKGSFDSFYSNNTGEGFGESLGIGGPILVNGQFGKQPGVMVYDNFGMPVGQITRQQATQFPHLAGDLIATADERSAQNYQRQFLGGVEFEVARSVSLGARYIHRSAPQVLDDAMSIPDYSTFTPRSLAMPQMGIMPGDVQTLNDYINNKLINSRSDKDFDFWAGMHCCALIYVDEPIMDRRVAEEASAVVPNDPLFFNPPKGPAKPAKKKASQAMTYIGSAIKMGGVTLGAGEDSERDQGPVIHDQWGIQKVGYLPKSNPDSAWNIIEGQEKNVLIAVIDSGIDLTHPDGPQYIYTNPKEIPDNGKDDEGDRYIDDVHGWNFIDNNNDLTDYKGHGTFVAGIIAAKANNGQGIAGINPGAEILMLKVTDKFGHTNNLNIARAIYYAVNHGAKIINISIAGKGKSKLEQLAINYAFGKGVLVVVAGGNDGDYANNDGPGFSKRSLTVGAVDYEGPVSTITNWGPNLALVAPGEKIYSLYSKDSEWVGSPMDKERLYYKASGTSFAAPMVAGTASLMLLKDPKLTHRQMMDILSATATDLDNEGWDARSGAGLLNASQALKANGQGIFTAAISDVVINQENNKTKSVDIFAVVRGNIDSYTVELGKGKKPAKWDAVAGPFKRRAEYAWLCRIDQKAFQSSRDWCVRIKAVGKDGKIKTAESIVPFNVNKE